jgi:hypothetical protein
MSWYYHNTDLGGNVSKSNQPQVIHLWLFFSLSDSNPIVQLECESKTLRSSDQIILASEFYFSGDWNMIFQGYRKFESHIYVNAHGNLFSSVSIQCQPFPINPLNQISDPNIIFHVYAQFRSLLNSKHSCSTLCSWKEFSCRNSFWSLVFIESVLHYKQNIFQATWILMKAYISSTDEMARVIFPGTFLRASSSQVRIDLWEELGFSVRWWFSSSFSV